MSKPIVYYKVITDVGDKLTSAWLGTASRDEKEVISMLPAYKHGEWISAEVGPLFVFSNMDAAKEFKNSWGDEIWECSCKISMKVEWIDQGFRSVRIMVLERVWKKILDTKEFYIQRVPPYTRTFKCVKLLRRVF